MDERREQDNYDEVAHEPQRQVGRTEVGIVPECRRKRAQQCDGVGSGVARRCSKDALCRVQDEEDDVPKNVRNEQCGDPSPQFFLVLCKRNPIGVEEKQKPGNEEEDGGDGAVEQQ